ncbi:MAG: MetQ/NlpA family ABC transporter substrate-binding protein [Kofleriaceae bacterium]
MRHIAFIVAGAALAFAASCGRGAPDPHELRVGASPTPHAAILRQAAPALAAEGYKLTVVEMTDYVQPNLALVDGSLEANFFQHQPYLAQFNADRGADLVAIASVHVEPLALYARAAKALDQLAPGAVIAIPNDPTNTARALALLGGAGLITLPPGPPPSTARGLASPRGIQLRELDAAQLPRVLDDVDAAVINTNYALEAGLRPDRDALVREGAGASYANVLVVRAALRNDPRVQALARALTSPATRAFIERELGGAVVPAF